MLIFLAIAAQSRIIADRYADSPIAVLGENCEGQIAITQIVRSLQVEVGGNTLSAERIKILHEKAHKNCFTANSIQGEVSVK